MRTRIVVLVVVALLIAGAGGWYWNEANAPGEPFSKDGVLMLNNPGFKPDAWFLSYEEPGAPALSVELRMDAASQCATDDGYHPCALDEGWQGKPVHVQGVVRNGVVSVDYLSLRIETGTEVRLYYYNPEKDGGPDNIQCSRAGLVPVQRVLSSPDDLEAQTIRLLLRGELSAEERAEGVTTEFPLEGLALVSARNDEGELTLTFADPRHTTSGGSCRVTILRAQIEETAMQFPGVESVRLLPEELFQP